jgi:hypothetical protein
MVDFGFKALRSGGEQGEPVGLGQFGMDQRAQQRQHEDQQNA